jgi:PAS domain S-box-containing protein
MATAPITELLAAWRAAERRWENAGSAEEVATAASEVVRSWAAYQDAGLAPDTREFVLVADDHGVYVAATKGVSLVLGFEPSELIGLRIEDLASSELRQATPEQWSQFLADGRQDGRFRLTAKDGAEVSLRYQARAHHPVPGFHLSRLWPDDRSTGED